MCFVIAGFACSCTFGRNSLLIYLFVPVMARFFQEGSSLRARPTQRCEDKCGGSIPSKGCMDCGANLSPQWPKDKSTFRVGH